MGEVKFINGDEVLYSYGLTMIYVGPDPMNKDRSIVVNPNSICKQQPELEKPLIESLPTDRLTLKTDRVQTDIDKFITALIHKSLYVKNDSLEFPDWKVGGTHELKTELLRVFRQIEGLLNDHQKENESLKKQHDELRSILVEHEEKMKVLDNSKATHPDITVEHRERCRCKKGTYSSTAIFCDNNCQW